MLSFMFHAVWRTLYGERPGVNYKVGWKFARSQPGVGRLLVRLTRMTASAQGATGEIPSWT
jgi:hypothetical protein